jgi:hypothetical protein
MEEESYENVIREITRIVLTSPQKMIREEDLVNLSRGFEFDKIVLDSIADDIRIDSIGHFTEDYRDMIDEFLRNPIDRDSLFSIAKHNKDLKPKAILYAPVASLDEFTVFEIDRHNTQFVAGFPLRITDTLVFQDTSEVTMAMVDTSRPLDTIFTASIDTHIVELAIFSPDTSDFSFKPLVLKKGIKIGMHYNELIQKLGIGFMKKGNRLFYHNWSDRIGIFEVGEDGFIQSIIIGQYAVDFSAERDLPSFYLNYVSF